MGVVYNSQVILGQTFDTKLLVFVTLAMVNKRPPYWVYSIGLFPSIFKTRLVQPMVDVEAFCGYLSAGNVQ